MRLAVLTNILTPYRIPLYNELLRLTGEITVFISPKQKNRQWEFKKGNCKFTIKNTFGFLLKQKKCRYGIRNFNVNFVHIPLGIIWDLTKFNPNAVLSIKMGFRTFFAWIYCFIKRTPLVVQWGGTIHTEKNTGIFRKFVRKNFFAKVIKIWVSYGSTSTEYLELMGIPRDNIFETINTIDVDFFAKMCPPTLSLTSKPVLLYVGSFVPRKGLNFFFKSISALKEKGINFTVLLIGSGSQEKELKNMAQEFGLKNIIFHPFVQYDELPGIYQSADVFVFPTLEDVWGLVVNEALASGLPVLCSKYAGCARDLIPENWQFDPIDIEKSFVPALEKAIAKGREARNEFLALSELKGPRETAQTILKALEKASNQS